MYVVFALLYFLLCSSLAVLRLVLSCALPNVFWELSAAFSNTLQGIEGAIVLGLAHGFVSSGLFICATITESFFNSNIVVASRKIKYFLLDLINC